jgi:hypothetical protein
MTNKIDVEKYLASRVALMAKASRTIERVVALVALIDNETDPYGKSLLEVEFTTLQAEADAMMAGAEALQTVMELEAAVRLPRSEPEASMYVLLGMDWLEHNAPHRLRDTASSLREVKHKKRGTEYAVFAEAAVVQTDDVLEDNDLVTVYRGEDGKWFVRPQAEMKDGRFEEPTDGA